MSTALHLYQKNNSISFKGSNVSCTKKIKSTKQQSTVLAGVLRAPCSSKLGHIIGGDCVISTSCPIVQRRAVAHPLCGITMASVISEFKKNHHKQPHSVHMLEFILRNTEEMTKKSFLCLPSSTFFLCKCVCKFRRFLL